MVPSELGPQLRFLTDAAHLLSASSPETSAFLLSRRTSLLVEHDLTLTDHQRQHVCSCCGHMMVPGQGTQLRLGTDQALKTRTRKLSKTRVAPAAPAASSSSQRQSRTGICKVLTCGKCGRYTRIQLPPPNLLVRARARANTQGNSNSKTKRVDHHETPQEKRPASAAEPAKLSANASSKKRAKNRKAGLQALLDRRNGQTPSSSSGLGLSLSDFMKK